MSQHAVERTIGKLVTDPAFRGRFFRDPGAASLCAGLDLSPTELDALSRMSPRLLAQVTASLDGRIRRMAVADIAAPVEERP